MRLTLSPRLINYGTMRVNANEGVKSTIIVHYNLLPLVISDYIPIGHDIPNIIQKFNIVIAVSAFISDKTSATTHGLMNAIHLNRHTEVTFGYSFNVNTKQIDGGWVSDDLEKFHIPYEHETTRKVFDEKMDEILNKKIRVALLTSEKIASLVNLDHSTFYKFDLYDNHSSSTVSNFWLSVLTDKLFSNSGLTI